MIERETEPDRVGRENQRLMHVERIIGSLSERVRVGRTHEIGGALPDLLDAPCRPRRRRATPAAARAVAARWGLAEQARDRGAALEHGHRFARELDVGDAERGVHDVDHSRRRRQRLQAAARARFIRCRRRLWR